MTVKPKAVRELFIAKALLVNSLIGPKVIGISLIFILSSCRSHSLRLGPRTHFNELRPRGKLSGPSIAITSGCIDNVESMISGSE